MKSNVTEASPIIIAMCGDATIPATDKQIDNKLTADYHYNS